MFTGALPSRVLLIEDDVTYAFLIREFLNQSSTFRFETIHMNRLAPGLERLRNERFDIALVDLGLPDSDGLDTIKKVNEAAPYLPLIILSGNTDEAVSLEGVTQGAQDYLLKGSFDSNGLTRAIHYAIERKKNERFKEDFSGIVSHELRAPLAVIKGAVDGIKDETFGPLNDKQKQFLELASKHIKRMAKIITNILDLARYESGKAVLEWRALKPADIIEDAVAPFRAEAAQKNVRLTVDAPASLPAVRTDPDLAAEVVANLCGNALRFARNAVTIAASPDPNDATAMRFSVRDDGPGVPNEKLRDVFNKFARIDKDAAVSGSGLGLSLCKTIVHLLEGRIHVENAPDGGARFHFTLPRAPS